MLSSGLQAELPVVKLVENRLKTGEFMYSDFSVYKDMKLDVQ